MQTSKDVLLVITNLYPVPWANNRASFNKQQFDIIAEKQSVEFIILLPWLEWFKHRKQCMQTNNLRYCPYFHIPVFFKRLANPLVSMH